MSPFQIVIILVCAALGFGIVSNMVGSVKKDGPTEDDRPPDRDEM